MTRVEKVFVTLFVVLISYQVFGLVAYWHFQTPLVAAAKIAGILAGIWTIRDINHQVERRAIEFEKWQAFWRKIHVEVPAAFVE
jgi:hypothetical protein